MSAGGRNWRLVRANTDAVPSSARRFMARARQRRLRAAVPWAVTVGVLVVVGALAWMVYGTAAERPRDANGRVWFHLARNTRLGLEEAASGDAPAIAHYAVTVAPFDRQAFEARLRELKARVMPSADEPDVVRFADDSGIIVEVRAAS